MGSAGGSEPVCPDLSDGPRGPDQRPVGVQTKDRTLPSPKGTRRREVLVEGVMVGGWGRGRRGSKSSPIRGREGGIKVCLPKSFGVGPRSGASTCSRVHPRPSFPPLPPSTPSLSAPTDCPQPRPRAGPPASTPHSWRRTPPSPLPVPGPLLPLGCSPTSTLGLPRVLQNSLLPARPGRDWSQKHRKLEAWTRTQGGWSPTRRQVLRRGSPARWKSRPPWRLGARGLGRDRYQDVFPPRVPLLRVRDLCKRLS